MTDDTRLARSQNSTPGGKCVRRTGCTAKAVSWALVYLSAVQLIERSNSDERNPRYLRYRVTTK